VTVWAQDEHRLGLLPIEVHLVFLPPYSPELQPAERLWALVDEPVENRVCPDLDAPEAVLVARCRDLVRERRRVRDHTRLPWWPRERRPWTIQ